MAVNGRPKKTINWDQVNILCELNYNGEEIASLLCINYDTLNRSCKHEKNASFKEYANQRRDIAKLSESKYETKKIKTKCIDMDYFYNALKEFYLLFDANGNRNNDLSRREITEFEIEEYALFHGNAAYEAAKSRAMRGEV